MAAQIGSGLLIKRDSNGAGSFVDLAGLRTKSMQLNAETVDITNSDSTNKWRELLAGAGIKSASVSGAGVFKDGAPDEGVRADFFGGLITDYQIVVPDFGTIEGPFQISQLQYSGEHNAEVAWDIALESAGELTFAAA